MRKIANKVVERAPKTHKRACPYLLAHASEYEFEQKAAMRKGEALCMK